MFQLAVSVRECFLGVWNFKVHICLFDVDIYACTFRIPDAELYETLTEDFLTDQISKVMGSIDSQLVSDVMEICLIENLNRNENHDNASGAQVGSWPMIERVKI